MMVATVIGIFTAYLFWSTHLGYMQLGSSGSADTNRIGCFCPWTFSLNIDDVLSYDDYIIYWDIRVHVTSNIDNFTAWMLHCRVKIIYVFDISGSFLSCAISES